MCAYSNMVGWKFFCHFEINLTKTSQSNFAQLKDLSNTNVRLKYLVLFRCVHTILNKTHPKIWYFYRKCYIIVETVKYTL